MEIPDPIIECLRCTASDAIHSSMIRREGNAWKSVNGQRPEKWIAGPADPQDVTKGICPRCVPDYEQKVRDFLLAPPKDETIELREPSRDHTRPPISSAHMLQTPVRALHDTNIPLLPDSAATARSSIPQRAAPLRAPEPLRTVLHAPNARMTHHAPQPQKVSCAPIQTTILAPNITRNTIASGPVATQHVQAVPLQRPAPSITLPATAYAPATMTPNASPIKAGVQGGGLVSMSAPVPIPPPQPGAGGSFSAVVTEAVPIDPEFLRKHQEQQAAAKS